MARRWNYVKKAIAVHLGDSRLFEPKNLTLEIDEPQSLFPS
ncbi:hypothetical protein DSBG_0818 [Desulfosporosinus sp. BG]|nr:hypothetical protein DSBG_0818 [Desulfosporosinus sp. BG]